MKIFVSGPYSHGDIVLNIRNAIVAADTLRAMGHTPFIPHTMTSPWHLVIPHDDAYWYTLDLEWLLVCDAVFRISGESVGADNDVKRAQELGMPVFYNYEDVPKNDLLLEQSHCPSSTSAERRFPKNA